MLLLRRLPRRRHRKIGELRERPRRQRRKRLRRKGQKRERKKKRKRGEKRKIGNQGKGNCCQDLDHAQGKEERVLGPDGDQGRGQNGSLDQD